MTELATEIELPSHVFQIRTRFYQRLTGFKMHKPLYNKNDSCIGHLDFISTCYCTMAIHTQ